MSLRIEGVSKRFGEVLAVDNLNLEIPNNQLFGLLGANGAGKTTTIRMILGLLAPSQGQIRWNGEKLGYAISDQIGYLPEERGLYPKLKVSEQLTYLGMLRGMERRVIEAEIPKWLNRFRITDYANKKVEELSKGNQQKIQFIASVIHKPKLLFLDEPFSGLDPINVELLKDVVKEIAQKGTTIVFSSHLMQHVEELCSDICIMHKGSSVVKGNLREIKRSFGRKNVIIHTDENLDSLRNVGGVLKVNRTAEGYVVQINEDSVSQKLFREVASRGFTTKFVLEEPSLNDIFIEKVGASYE